MNQHKKEDSGRPLYQSYPVANDAGVIYAGEYPGDREVDFAKDKIDRMLAFGIRHFVDLTEEGELAPYDHLLPAGTTYDRFPIRDEHCPRSVQEVLQLLRRIDQLKQMEGFTYIHCWGGVGRTGTIVACYLAQYSAQPTLEHVLASLRGYFKTMPKSAYRHTPENFIQVNFIRQFLRSLPAAQL